MLLYGIAYTPQGGALYNQRICWWKRYNEPALFTNRFHAQKEIEFIRRICPNSKPEIVVEKEARRLNDLLVQWMRDGTYSKLMQLAKEREAKTSDKKTKLSQKSGVMHV